MMDTFLTEHRIAQPAKKGHQFLANIRQDTNWNKVKTVAETVGSKSLDVLSNIASDVIATVAKSAMGLP